MRDTTRTRAFVGALALIVVPVAVAVAAGASSTPPAAAPTTVPMVCAGTMGPLGGDLHCAPAGPTISHSPTTSPSPTPTNTPSPTLTTVTPTVTPTATPTSTTPKPTPSPTATGQQIKVYLTGYSYFDNTPPGSADISNPVIHQKAGGTGTFGDALTLAVGHTLSGGNDILDWPAGTRFFFPSLGPKGLWAIVEDTCGDGSKPQNGPCHTGYPSGASAWLDIWVDGRTAGEDASDQCMSDITGIVTAIMLPKGAPDPGWLPAGYVPGPISSAAGCQK